MMGFPVAQLALLWIITMTIQCGNGQTVTNHIPTKITYDTATAHTGFGDVYRNSAHGSYREIIIDGSDLVVGEKNRVGLYSTGDLAFQSAKVFPLVLKTSFIPCAALNPVEDDDFVCQNYITTINEHNTDWYYCGTSGLNPQCWKCDVQECTDNEVMNGNFGTGDKNNENVISNNPYLDHQPLLFYDNPTGVITDDRIFGGDLEITQGGIIQGGTIRSDGTFPASISVKPRPETKIGDWTNFPNYVSDPIQFMHSAVDNVVYYFFNEIALEYANVEKRIFPRIARICRDDGGSFFNNDADGYFSTFLKARLNCSIPAFNGVTESGYDYLRDVYQPSGGSNLLFMVFSDVPNPTSKHANSAVCVFQFDIIDFIFKNSKFKGQGAKFYPDKTTDSIWEPPVDTDVASLPSRPGTCPSIDTENEQDFQEFITDYVLLNSTIPGLQVYPATDPATIMPPPGRKDLDQSQPPIMLLDGIYATEMVVQENICGQTVFFLGTVDGKVYKAYTYGLNIATPLTPLVTRIVEEIDLTTGAAAGDDHEVLSMEVQIAANTVDTVIFVGTTSSLHRIPVQHCSTYTTYRECIIIQDPYCTWSASTSACIAIFEGSLCTAPSVSCTGQQCLDLDPYCCMPGEWPAPVLFNPTQDEGFAAKHTYDRIVNVLNGPLETERNVQIDMWVESEDTAVWGETTYACACGCPPVDFKETTGVRDFADETGKFKAYLIGVYTFDLSSCSSDVVITFTFKTNSNTLMEMVTVVNDNMALKTAASTNPSIDDVNGDDKKLYAYDYQASWWQRNKAMNRNAESAVCYNCPKT